ncbi:MAG: hypothetical protein DHS20C06_05720 [Hyphobacterium sp.]|nr:MAG: hypothetical protein DHS20C06_05720 [Hyphobacterium sp.]
MNENRFKELADAWGGDISRWPEAVQHDAKALIEKHGELRNYLQAATELDHKLDAPFHLPGSEFLQHRILATLPEAVFDAGWKRPAIAAAAALFVGLAGGFGGALVGPNEANSVVSLEYTDAFDGLAEDWMAWEWSDA